MKTDGLGDVGDRLIRLAQQQGGLFETVFDEVFVRRRLECGAERAQAGRLRAMRARGERVKRDVLGVVRGDVLEDVLVRTVSASPVFAAASGACVRRESTSENSCTRIGAAWMGGRSFVKRTSACKRARASRSHGAPSVNGNNGSDVPSRTGARSSFAGLPGRKCSWPSGKRKL